VSGLGDKLLSTAAAELASGGFDTRIGDLAPSGHAWLLAENELFLLGVVVEDGISDLAEIEPYASTQLMELVDRGDAQSKRWDVYLVLLSLEIPTNSEEIQVLSQLEHNLRTLRRIVAVGVTGEDELRVALAPFLPLKRAVGDLQVAALEALRDELIVNGVSVEVADRYISIFKEKGSLSDV
jgi:hypothetical protein